MSLNVHMLASQLISWSVGWLVVGWSVFHIFINKLHFYDPIGALVIILQDINLSIFQESSNVIILQDINLFYFLGVQQWAKHQTSRQFRQIKKSDEDNKTVQVDKKKNDENIKTVQEDKKE